MEYFEEFMNKYFFYIWLFFAILLAYFLIIRGKKVLQLFSDLDLNNIVYSEKNASGHIVRSAQTRRAGVSKFLHVIITDQELILKTYLFFAHIANENNMLHRIPLQNIVALESKKEFMSSKLFIRFREVTGEEKVMVIQSKNIERIKAILEQYIR